MIRNFINYIFISILLLGCTSVERTRLTTNLKAYEYNDVASIFMERPTFVEYQIRNKQEVLYIKVHEYGNQNYDANNVKFLALSYEYIDDYITMIDKYLTWEEIALSRNDAFEKRIGQSQSNNGVINFTFYSSNSSNHYLIIATDTPIGDLMPIYFPKNEAINLKNLLIDFKNHDWNKVNADINNIYQ